MTETGHMTPKGIAAGRYLKAVADVESDHLDNFNLVWEAAKQEYERNAGAKQQIDNKESK